MVMRIYPRERGWVARDKSGCLIFYYQKPEKGKSGWLSAGLKKYLQKNEFPEVKWEDEEPTKAEIFYFGTINKQHETI